MSQDMSSLTCLTFLQPTRIMPKKWIELSEFCRGSRSDQFESMQQTDEAHAKRWQQLSWQIEQIITSNQALYDT